MSRTGRRFIAAIALTVIIVGIGTVGGFFDVFDLINRVQTSTVDNDLGGSTFMKVASEDKTVSWPKSYDEDFMPTVDGEKAYLWTDKTDEDDYIIEYYMIYRSEKSVDEVIKFYSQYYTDSETLDLDQFVNVTAYHDGYMMTASIEKDGDMTEVTLRAVFPEE